MIELPKGTTHIDPVKNHYLKMGDAGLLYWGNNVEQWLKMSHRYQRGVEMRMEPLSTNTFKMSMFTKELLRNPCSEINLRPSLSIEETNKMTTTSKELNKELTPEVVQEKKMPTYIQVEKLEYANHQAVGEIMGINRCEQSEKFSIDTSRARTDIPEKYHNRLKGILRDMRKDQEAILDETAATIAKVNKALG